MSASAKLKAAATGTEVATTADKAKPKSIAQLLVDPNVKAQMALALPKHVTADRLARIALTEIRKVPKLAQCDQTSFLGAIMQCAALGLEPGGALGHAYLLPFDKREKVGGQWKVTGTAVQLIVGYRGMIDLARRSGQILSIEARAVYEADHFEVELGLDSRIVHRPDWSKQDRGELTFVYAVAKLKDGGVQFDVMSRAEIEAVRNASQGYKAAESAAQKYNKEADSPWHKHFEEMAKKTVVRRIFKYLPVSIEIQRAVGLDEQADAGVAQDNPLVIEGNYSVVEAGQQEAGNDGGDPSAATLAELERAATDPIITPEEVEAKLRAAADMDALNDAYDLVRDLGDDDRKRMVAVYAECKAAFEG